METCYDVANSNGFSGCDKMWLYNAQRSKGLSQKLTSKHDVYRIQKILKRMMAVVKLDKLKPFQPEHCRETDWDDYP